jgi:hypothetical protein
MRDNAFQLDESVDPYRVASSNDLEDNLKFHVGENTFIDIKVEELNDILRNSRHTEVNKDDDSDELNIQDCDRDDEIEEEEDENSD